MLVDKVLLNCKVYMKEEILEGGIAIENGKIIKIGKEPNLPKSSEKINLQGYLALPGLIDIHVHLRDQRQAYEETFYTGSAAAAAGGITTVVDMPNNEPVTMSVETLRQRMELAEKQALTNIAFYSAFPPDKNQIPRIVKEGAVAFKIFLIRQIGGLSIDDDDEIVEALEITGSLNVPVAFHAENRRDVEALVQELMLENRNNIEAYLEAHNTLVEAKSVERVLKLAESSKAKVHLCHVSSIKSLKLILEAKGKGLDVTCEVTPHHLLLSTEDFWEKGSLLITDPPVRSKEERQGLWKALKNGVIDVLASDHAPHLLEEKFSDEIWKVKPGIPGLQTTLPLMLTQISKGFLSIHDLVRLMAENPAKIFGFKGKGFLKEGFSADITVVDLRREGIIDPSKFYSKAKYSPFDGWQVRGMPIKTFVNGVLVMDEGEIVAKPGVGKILRKRN